MAATMRVHEAVGRVVTACAAKPGWRLWVRFSDDAEGELDLSSWIYHEGGPIFLPLRAPEIWQRAEVQGGTVSWPNGADIAPETLYRLLIDSPAVEVEGLRAARRQLVIAIGSLTNVPGVFAAYARSRMAQQVQEIGTRLRQLGAEAQ